MAVTDPEKVPQKKITSVDVTGFSGGLYLNGEQNGEGNQYVAGENVERTLDGFIRPRKTLQKWLPDTIGTIYQIFPALIDGELYYFTADDGKIRYCQQGDTDWTECGGANEINTGEGIKTTFLRVQDVLLVLNGSGGDKLCYVELDTKDVVKYEKVEDPDTAPTASATGITASGDYRIYYGFTFSSATGETKLSPILTQTINKPRSDWDPDGSEYLEISRPSGNPDNATNWNLYIALAPSGATIRDTDMLMLASGLDLATTKITDNGTLAIDIGRGTPPEENSTDGPRVKHGIETNGRPILFGDVDAPYNIWIGGDGDDATNFSPSSGGFRSEVSKGTNYYPASVIGFRNGQGIPALTILFSNTEGLSKQATLEQQTINFGNQSFVVWGVTEQNYGAAGVASSYGVVNYNGSLSFPSTDGFMSMDTQPQLQNVLATQRISGDIEPEVRRIKTSALDEIVGTAWDNRFMWIVPARGFDTPNTIFIRDLNNNGSWDILQIKSQWIGVVSPPDSPAFVYICQGNKILKLFESFGTVDYRGDGGETFRTYARGTLIGSNDAHNGYYALVQAMFYLMNVVGTVNIGVNYRDRFGNIKTRQRTFQGPEYVASSSGGWSDPQYNYANFDMPATWGTPVEMDAESANLTSTTERVPLIINDLASEMQWWIETPKGLSDYLLKSISYQGENLGVKPDLR